MKPNRSNLQSGSDSSTIIINSLFWYWVGGIWTVRLLSSRYDSCCRLALMWLTRFAFACGASNKTCCWLRAPKLFLSYAVLLRRSPTSPAARSSSVRRRVQRLAYRLGLVVHLGACVWFYVGSQYQVAWKQYFGQTMAHFSLILQTLPMCVFVLSLHSLTVRAELVSWDRNKLVHRRKWPRVGEIHWIWQIWDGSERHCLGGISHFLLLGLQHVNF